MEHIQSITSLDSADLSAVADDVRGLQETMGWSEASDEEIAEAVTELRAKIRGGRLTVYRALETRSLGDIRPKGHRHWSFDERYAVPYGGGGGGAMIITATLSEKEVDWLSTIAVQTMGEREIRPDDGATLAVVYIEDAGGEQVSFKAGMTLTA